MRLVDLVVSDSGQEFLPQPVIMMALSPRKLGIKPLASNDLDAVVPVLWAYVAVGEKVRKEKKAKIRRRMYFFILRVF